MAGDACVEYNLLKRGKKIMAAPDGVARLYLLARRITFWGFLAGLALWLLGFVLVRLGFGELILLLVVPLILGAILWAIAWIVEGFALRGKGD
jgi:hypothetical protein